MPPQESRDNSGQETTDSGDQANRLGKLRTWWHPLLVRLLNRVMASAYEVRDEELVGRLPLRVDIVLIRREQGQLSYAGQALLACYAAQQVHQFNELGEEFAMQHADTEYLGELDEDLKTAVLEIFEPEERVRGLSVEDLRGIFTTEELLRGLPPEERLRGLSEEELDRVSELLERRRDA